MAGMKKSPNDVLGKNDSPSFLREEGQRAREREIEKKTEDFWISWEGGRREEEIGGVGGEGDLS